MFLTIYKQKVRDTTRFLRRFCDFWPAGGLFASFNTPTPPPAHTLPHQQSVHQAVSELPSLSLALSK
jgi:hypothetical protein